MSKDEEVITDSPQFFITGLSRVPDTDEIKVDYKITPEFKVWYKDKHDLKRWSRKHFEKTLVEMISKDLKKQHEKSKISK